MRKITFLFYALLFCCFGAAAQPEGTTGDGESLGDLTGICTDYVYAIRSKLNGNPYLYSKDTETYLCSNNNNKNNEPYGPDVADYQFVFYKASLPIYKANVSNDASEKVQATAYYYIYSLGSRKFIGTAGGNTVKFANIPMTENITNAIEIRELKGDNTDPYRFMLSTNGESALTAGGSYGAQNWGRKDDGGNGYDVLTNDGSMYSLIQIKNIDQSVLTKVEEIVTEFELNTLLNLADAYLSAPEGAVGTSPGLKEKINDLKDKRDKAYNNKSKDTRDELISVLNDIENLTGVVEFENNQYYRIISAYPGFEKMVGLQYQNIPAVNGAASCGYLDDGKGHINKRNVDAIFQIEKTDRDDNSYFIKHCNKDVYIQGAGGKFNPNSGGNGYVQFVGLGGAQYNLFFGNGKSGVDTELSAPGLQTNPTDTGINSPAAWYIVPATDIEVSMNPDKEEEQHYWASTYLPFAVSTPENSGLQIFTGSVSGESLKLNEVSTLPAETGAVLKGSAETCTLNIVDATASTDEVENAESNALEGYLTETTVGTASDYLVLSMVEGEVGFYRSGSTTLKANKAYLPASVLGQGVNGLRFSFGEATGIDNAAAERNADMGAVYDLSGRRVAAPASGIYVKDGKKIFIR